MAADDSRLPALRSACQQAMLRDTCGAMRSHPGGSPAAGGVVIVAGVGPVPAALLRDLQQAGAAMCDQVAGACQKEGWESASCRAMRALYGAT